MNQILVTEALIIELLLVVSLVALVVRRLRVPYTVALVLAGLLITFGQQLEINLTPELILSLFVPPLVFEAALHLEYRRLRENMWTLLVLAIPGVLLATVIVAFVVSGVLGFSLKTALVFGALIAATDPVAVVALFRQLGAPKRLTLLVEGESLFNDGTAIVVFQLMLVAALPVAIPNNGINEVAVPTSSIDLVAAIVSFVRVSVGGILIGAALGWLVSLIIARVDDYLIETTLTTILAFGAFLIGERFHVSGVLAVVVAGIVCGNTGLKGMSPTTRIVLFNFWEYLAFVTNSLVFLMIGLDVNIRQLADRIPQIAVGVLAVFISRALVIYGLTWLTNIMLKGQRTVSWPYRHVLFWGGLRGAISLALVLSLPESFADRDELRVMTFGVVLFTLLAQGTTMQVLMRRLGLTGRNESELEYERRHGRLLAVRAGREHLRQLHDDGLISASAWEQLGPESDREVQQQLAAQQALLADQPSLRAEELEDARREALRAERAMLARLFSNGIISETIYEELVTDVDAKLTRTRPKENLPTPGT
jgi:Na+:H+ antiporter